MDDAELDVMNTEQDDPLLQPGEHDVAESISDPIEPVTVRRKINQTQFIIICIGVLFVLDFAAFFDLIPQTRIFELIVCRNYFDKHHPDRFPYPQDIPEEECKIKAVQSQVAYIQAIGSSFDALPSILLLLPYGQLADNPRYGRRFVLRLSMAGILLGAYWALLVCSLYRYVPLQAIWIGGFFALIGGGPGVTNAMVMTMVSDAVDEANRSTVYFQTSLAAVVAQLLAPAIGSAMMMKLGPWIPYFVGTAFFTLCCFLILLVPETIPIQVSKSSTSHSASSGFDRGSVRGSLEVHRPVSRPSLAAKMKALFATAWKETKAIFSNRTVLLILSTFLLSTLGRKQIDLLLLYASSRYEITLSKAGFVHSFMACVSIVLLLLVLPLTSSYLSKTLSLPSNQKDLWLSKISIVLLTVGSFAIGFSPTFVSMICAVAIYTLGCGFTAVCLSLISGFVDPKYSARLYSVISLIVMMGTLIGGPLLAGLFNLGLNMGSPAWTGLPFFGSGVIHIFVLVSVWLIRLPSVQLE
ncbi:hypothetical protein MGYG_02987 [Nannizzia gypsea CBS 118893]|uniref:Major facilitator superfamily (MFS) profile domain-containing protein n=1 Tax=Arthroderma gypseum (strain ATCC MYA-4604 / CBS 118893) TaxID=535722 RepID=E4UQ60_ARTGP|nr:hypothetical protein MGYG_02987 [Nannizzia gypsea CBS 118893]EFQ99979.1 hypothetical protein MGYG_02987 [Nannizzia gypsea CBS 118893]